VTQSDNQPHKATYSSRWAESHLAHPRTEAAHRLANPAPIAGVTVIIVAAFGIFINGLTAWLFALGRSDDINIEGAFLHIRAAYSFRSLRQTGRVKPIHIGPELLTYLDQSKRASF
jgi:hypothetical protein